MESALTRRSSRLPAAAALAGIAAIFAMAARGVLSHPSSVAGRETSGVILAVTCLLIYATAAILTLRPPLVSAPHPLALGARIGLILSACAVVNMSLEHFVALGPGLSALRGVSMWALMFMLYGAAGSITWQRTASPGLSLAAALWASVLSTIATVAFGFALTVFAMPYMRHILADAFAQSAMHDSAAFVVRNTLESASSHLIIAPMLAVLFGGLGAAASALLSSLNRRTALAAAACGLCLLVIGILALWRVSILPRPERPPFVLVGLLTLGIVFGSAHPLLAALLRQTPQAPDSLSPT